MSQKRKPSLRKPSLVKIVNPMPGGREHCTRERAERYRRAGDAEFDAVGRLVFKVGRRRSAHSAVFDIAVVEYSGSDALPGRAVMPPSAAVLAREGTPGRRVKGIEA